MIVDPAVIPGLLILAAELAALAAVGYVVVRVALRQSDDRVALAQGLVVGPALWGLITNFVLYAVPGLAGAAVGWGVTLALGAVLARRSPQPLRPRLGTAVGFAGAFLVLLWLALASRQLLEMPDPTLHLGLAAWIRAGGFPPEVPWNPGHLVRYHHGVDLLVGLLTPPVGPDLAFVQELLGAYAWTSFALVVVTALLRRGSWKLALVISPLFVTAGAWTWTSLGGGILQGPVPAGLPAAGFGASLADIYWPSAGSSGALEPTVLHDIWTPAFTLGYALAFVVLERAARSEGLSWPSVLVLAGIVGFVGILVTSLVPVLIVLWAALAAVHVVQNRRGRAVGAARRWGAGLGLAAVLLLFGGGAFTAFLDGGSSAGLGLTWDLNRTHWEALGTFDAPLGGVGVLGLGPLVIAGFAVLLARRDRLVLTLAAGAGLLVLGWLVLSYPTAPWVLSRLAGHARNLALVALLLALTGVFSARLAKPLRHSREGGNPAPGEPGAARDSTMESFARLCLADVRRCGLSPALWRSSLAVLLVGLIVWPTIAAPVRSLGHAVGSGVQLANAAWVQQEMRSQEPADRLRRFQLPAMSDRLASDIRDHTSLHARVLTPEWPHWAVSLATGRPNGAGFADLHHLIYFTGPEYLDARNNLEPGAIRRLGIEYVHATDAWAAGLPPRARRWLADPDLFELVARDGTEALYRIRQAILELDVEPQPASFEALRPAPSSTVVYLAPETMWLDRLRVASVLSHTRLSGAVDTQLLHLQRPVPWTVEPLGDRIPDLVVLPASMSPAMFPGGEWQQIWRNQDIAVYEREVEAEP